jgi:hypothetical protein
MIFGRDFEVWDQYDQDVFTFTKLHPDSNINEKMLVFLNFSDEQQPLHYPTGTENVKKELVVSNVDGLAKYLAPWEGRVYLIRESVVNGA